MKNTQAFFLIFIVFVTYGCQSTYWIDRKNDSLDIVSCSYGYGIGVKPRVGPIVFSPFHFYKAKKGVKGGEVYTNSGDIDSSYIMPFSYLESFYGGENAFNRKKSYTSTGVIVFVFPEPYRGPSWIAWDICPEVKSDAIEDKIDSTQVLCSKNDGISYSYYSDIEVLLALGIGAKIGFNPGELLDFILGWTTLDIYDDDIGLIKEDLSGIKECLSRTIIELNHKKNVSRTRINIKSIEGATIIQNENLFLLGDWAIELKNNIAIARYSMSTSSHEDKVLFIEMKKILNNYAVVKWYFTNLIFD